MGPHLRIPHNRQNDHRHEERKTGILSESSVLSNAGIGIATASSVCFHRGLTFFWKSVDGDNTVRRTITPFNTTLELGWHNVPDPFQLQIIADDSF